MFKYGIRQLTGKGEEIDGSSASHRKGDGEQEGKSEKQRLRKKLGGNLERQEKKLLYNLKARNQDEKKVKVASHISKKIHMNICGLDFRE